MVVSILCSNRLTEKQLQALLDEPSVDVWRVDEEGRLDIRMSRQLYERLGWEECSVLHESVEQLVVDFEEQLLNQSRADADWFEEYVSVSKLIRCFSSNITSTAELVAAWGMRAS